MEKLKLTRSSALAGSNNERSSLALFTDQTHVTFTCVGCATCSLKFKGVHTDDSLCISHHAFALWLLPSALKPTSDGVLDPWTSGEQCRCLGKDRVFKQNQHIHKQQHQQCSSMLITVFTKLGKQAGSCSAHATGHCSFAGKGSNT
jgi:hypothetical protein